MLALEPLSVYPNTYNVGGTQWKCTTEIASDLFGRCAGRAFIQNLTEYVPTYKYRWNAALPAQVQEAPYFGSESIILFGFVEELYSTVLLI